MSLLLTFANKSKVALFGTLRKSSHQLFLACRSIATGLAKDPFISTERLGPDLARVSWFVKSTCQAFWND